MLAQLKQGYEVLIILVKQPSSVLIYLSYNLLCLSMFRFCRVDYAQV